LPAAIVPLTPKTEETFVEWAQPAAGARQIRAGKEEATQMKGLIVATLCGLLLVGIAGCKGNISDSSPAVQAFHRGGGGNR
jgi:hypothetical protein